MIEIDKILKGVVEKEVPDKEVAVLLSGGVDSLSLAFSAHRLGKKIHAYTFHLEDQPTYDSDKAKETADTFGWDIDTVIVPTDNLHDDFFTLLNKYKCKKKTQFECTFPFIYVFPKIKEKFVLCGIGADSWYGLSKKAMIHFSQTKTKFDQFRHEYFAQENPGGINQLFMLCKEYKKTICHPYLWDKSIEKFFMKYNHQELNKPKQKHHVRNAYQKEFSQIGKVKLHLNLQLEAKVDDLFELLLVNDKINFKKRTRIMDICRDWNTVW